MRLNTKQKVARRKHTIELLRWVYSRRDPALDGLHISHEHRRAQDMDTPTLTYGEVDVPDFLSILDIVKPRDGEIFVDLGSGTGKAVLASALGFPEFSECRGIELVQGLDDAANEHLRIVGEILATIPAPDDATIGAITSTDTCTRTHASKMTPQHLDGRNKRGTRGRGVGGPSKKGLHANKMADRGLSASELEELIVDSLKESSSQPLKNTFDRNDLGQMYTVEYIAAQLVKKLGHRRYKASLRGHGGLQKFLARKDGTISQRLEIAAEGGMVILKAARQAFLDDTVVSRDENSAGSEPCGTTRHYRSGLAYQEGKHQIDSYGMSLPYLQEDVHEAGHILDYNDIMTDVTTSTSQFLPSPTQVSALPTPVASLTRHALLLNSAGAAGSKGGPVEVTVSENGSSGSGSKRRGVPPSGVLRSESLRIVKFVCGDIFEEQWDDAGVVYVASLLFNDAMMLRLSQDLEKLTKGARVISLRPIPPPSDNVHSTDSLASGNASLRLTYEGVFKMSWQMARVYIYVRT